MPTDAQEAQQARNRQDASAAPPAPAQPRRAQPARTTAPKSETVEEGLADVAGLQPEGTFNGVPGGGELWKVDGTWWLIYYVPGTKPPVPLAWNVPNPADLTAIAGANPTPVRTLTGEQAKKQGWLRHGTTTELRNTSEHPFETFVADFDKEAEIRPWLRDPEIWALTAAAMLEGRAVTEAELKTTDWWRSRNDQQRAWVSLVASNPQEARRRKDDARRSVGEALRQAGVANAPTWLVNLLADRGTQGDWSEEYINGQVRKIADPLAPGKIDKDIAAYLGDTKLDRTRDQEQEVRDLARRWLGPVHGNLSPADLEKWSGILRNDPDGQVRFEDEMSRRRRALFPEYEDATLTYEDIAAPWRGVMQQTWGQTPDESDPLFTEIVRANDLATAQQMLRSEGVKRGVGTVVNDSLSALNSAFGGQSGLRRAQ